MKILLVDDHELLRSGMHTLLHGEYGDALELLYAENGCTALDMLESNVDLELILLDIDLPDIHGFQILQTLKRKKNAPPVLALSGNTDPHFIRQCLDFGASGFLPKSSSGGQMLAAIDLVHSGGGYIPREVMQARNHVQSRPSVLLTDRQLEVLGLLRKGLPDKSIAHTLGISLPTVKTHVRAILKQLAVNNRTEAVNEALLQGLI